MAWGDRGENAASDHFVGNFASRPLADRTFFRLLARQRHDLAGLLGGDLRGPSGTRDIAEAFTDAEVRERHCLQADPAHAPTANGVDAGLQFASNLPVL